MPVSGPNPGAPSYFARPSSARSQRSRALLNGLRELHYRDRAHHYSRTSDDASSSYAASSSRPSSAASFLSGSSCLQQQSNSSNTSDSALQRPRTGEDTGVSLAFLQEVARHVPAAETISQFIALQIAPACKEKGAASFLGIPGLVHARFVGPPDFLVALDPDTTTFHALVQQLSLHAARHAAAAGGRPAGPTYWLDCFTGMHHAAGGPTAPDRCASRVASARAAVAVQAGDGARAGAAGALLLLDSRASALRQAWPLHDAMWAVKARGSEALEVLPYGGATATSLLPALETASGELDVACCLLPGSAADQWHERQKLIKALEPHAITLEAVTLWVRKALAEHVRRKRTELEWDAAGSPSPSEVGSPSRVFVS